MESSNLFDFDHYKTFIKRTLQQRPKKGHGQFLKMAQYIRVHPTLITQIINGPKDFSLEQGLQVAEFLGLNDAEKDFFMGLIEYEKAGTQALKSYWRKRIELLREENKMVAKRIVPAQSLSQEQKTEFYSSWIYSAIRLSSSCPELQTAEVIAQKFDLPIKTVRLALDLLIQFGLVIKKGSIYVMGPARTHVSADSPLAVRHHSNWRLKALEAHPHLKPHELAFTAPVSIAKNDQIKVREIFLEAIEKVSKLVSKSNPEEVSCINIDWFDVR